MIIIVHELASGGLLGRCTANMRLEEAMTKKLKILAFPAACAVVLSSMLVQSQPAMSDDAQKFQGAYEFATFCATCHGTEGKGNGPMASVLKVAPTDLTVLSKNNGGVFPYESVFAMIEGRTTADAHGRDMPVWGDRYRLENPAPIVRARVLELLTYVKGLQE